VGNEKRGAEALAAECSKTRPLIAASTDVVIKRFVSRWWARRSSRGVPLTVVSSIGD
jgi:hypothetical protein